MTNGETAPAGRGDDERRGIGELLAAVAGNVVAVPIVLAFIALGGAVVATRALLGVRYAFGSRNGNPRPARKPRAPQPSSD